MDLKAKHHKLGSQGLRGAQQTSPCKKKKIILKKKNKNTKTNGDQKIIIIKKKIKRRKRKRIAGKFNSWLKITKQDTQVEGKSFSKDPLLREYIPFLIVYTKKKKK